MRADRQTIETNKYTDTLIVILRTPTRDEVTDKLRGPTTSLACNNYALMRPGIQR